MTGAVKRRQDDAASLVLVAIGLALITILSVWKLKQCKYRLVHETGGALFYGVLVGLVVRCLSFAWEQHVDSVYSGCSCTGLNSTLHILTINITSRTHCFRHVEEDIQGCPPRTYTETFDPEVLFNLFLPPIIFHGAYTLNQRRFIENLGSVLTFAFLGTIISCMTIGACVYGFTRLMVLLGHAADGEFFLTDCLLFGAIVSATDPVSVLGLLSELRVDSDLHTLLFGESVLNDGVAIALTHAITTYSQTGSGGTFDLSAFFTSIGYFLGILTGSFFMGFLFTVITALLTKFTRLCENPLLETSVFFLLSWCSFLAAEACGLSGIVAVLFCGLSQARYTVHNLSSEGRTRTKQLFEVFNFLGEIFIFSNMGYVLLTSPHHVFEGLFILGAFISIFLSRACNIYPLSFFLNLGRSNKISASFQHFMMLAGLRGVVAFSLAARDTSTKVKATIFTTTLLLVCFTIWVLGSAADPMLRCLDIRAGVDADENPEDFEVTTGRPDTAQSLLHHLDYKYVKPLLTHCGPPLADSLPQRCAALARIFSSPHVQENEEQLCEIEPDDSSLDFKKSDAHLESVESESGSEHQEDLLEGDLGLGTEAPVNSNLSMSASAALRVRSLPPTENEVTGQGI